MSAFESVVAPTVSPAAALTARSSCWFCSMIIADTPGGASSAGTTLVISATCCAASCRRVGRAVSDWGEQI